jgi:hypothetical protein
MWTFLSSKWNANNTVRSQLWAFQIKLLRFRYPSGHAGMSDLLRRPYVLSWVSRGLKTKTSTNQGLQINVTSNTAKSSVRPVWKIIAFSHSLSQTSQPASQLASQLAGRPFIPSPIHPHSLTRSRNQSIKSINSQSGLLGNQVSWGNQDIDLVSQSLCYSVTESAILSGSDLLWAVRLQSTLRFSHCPPTSVRTCWDSYWTAGVFSRAEEIYIKQEQVREECQKMVH